MLAGEKRGQNKGAETQFAACISCVATRRRHQKYKSEIRRTAGRENKGCKYLSRGSGLLQFDLEQDLRKESGI